MISVTKNFPFKECENCLAFDPSLRVNKLFGNFELLNHELEIYCGIDGTCREIRRQIAKEAESNGTDK